MISQVTLSKEELGSMIASVMEYNGKQAVQIQFVGAGEDFHATVVCEEPGLNVRVAPEGSPADRLRKLAEGKGAEE